MYFNVKKHLKTLHFFFGLFLNPATRNTSTNSNPATRNTSTYSNPATRNTSTYSNPATRNTSTYSNPAIRNTSTFLNPATRNTQTYPNPATRNTSTYSDPATRNTSTYSDPANRNTSTYSNAGTRNTTTYSDYPALFLVLQVLGIFVSCITLKLLLSCEVWPRNRGRPKLLVSLWEESEWQMLDETLSSDQTVHRDGPVTSREVCVIFLYLFVLLYTLKGLVRQRLFL